jgi:Glycosyltransferase sugar-binding region containing DXD motif
MANVTKETPMSPDDLDDPPRRAMSDHDLLLTGIGALPFRFAPPAGLPPRASAPLPKVVHMLWLHEELPERYVVLHEELRQHNPEWKVKVWHEIPFPLVNDDLFNAETNPGAKSDIARYEFVWRFGGTYLDVDFKSHGAGSLTERMTRPWVTVSGPPWYNCNNAQFGFEAGSEFLAYVIANLRDPRVRAQTCSTKRMGPTFWTTCILSFGDFRFVAEDGAKVVSKLEHLAHGNWVNK